jgi:hypothetical protein
VLQGHTIRGGGEQSVRSDRTIIFVFPEVFLEVLLAILDGPN